MDQLHMHVENNCDCVVSRRGFLKRIAAGAAAAGALGWKDSIALHAEDLRRREMACILLFMRGGPSQFETFDPKPGTETGGPTRAIPTSIAGVRLAQGWEQTARHMNDIALIRSVTNREGEHQRAVFQMHTGYIPVGGIRFPTLGSIVASEIAPREFDLPHFVKVGGRITSLSSGFLGMEYAPFMVANPSQMPMNVALPAGADQQRMDRRLNLLTDLEQDFAAAGGAELVQDHQALYRGAANMVRSPRMAAFDLSQESQATRTRYGNSTFGQGCLLARRLVEAGVTCVEVESNGWDTHQDNFDRSLTLSQTVDPAFAALLDDLKDRGRLDKTLVIWMGEFGRTPIINVQSGRGHFPRAFSVALAGAGVRGGQVIGATNTHGTEVTERPVSVPDLFNSYCHALGINPTKENQTPQGRPIRVVNGGQHIRELFA